MQHHLLEALNNSIRQTHTASDYQGTYRLPQNSRDLDLYIPSNRLHLLSDISKTLYWINDINAELYNQNNDPVIANNHQLHSLKDTMSHHIPEVRSKYPGLLFCWFLRNVCPGSGQQTNFSTAVRLAVKAKRNQALILYFYKAMSQCKIKYFL